MISTYDAWKLKSREDERQQKTRTVTLKKVVTLTCEVEVPVEVDGGFAEDVWGLWDEELVEAEEVSRDYE